MFRRSPALAIAFTAAALAGLAAPAAAAANSYRAEFASPPAAQRIVVRDVVWNCGGDSCAALQTSSRPATDCSALATRAGALRSFSVAGQPLSAEELEKCNARAR
jgi:hypothetical protein